ncbi:contactin-5-like isoform X2 [Pristis pectinata]|nr:contactin-5-like isoform X2 [Pristis pectinata]XP_051899419.1 contactin-5-like isoform X2 [Pristis pectinata]
MKWAEPSKHFQSRLQFNLSNGSLMVNGLKAGDQGDYSLMVDDRELKIIQLSLFGNLSEALILTTSISLGSTIELTCNVSGDPHQYRWWKDGGEISRLHQLIDGNRTLVILKASRRDCGIYTCVATNPASSIQTDCTLIIPGFLNKDIAIIVLSTISLVFSCVFFFAHVPLKQWKTKSEKAVKRLKRWRRLLNVCDSVSRVVAFSILIHWSWIEGSDLFAVAASCTVLLQLLTWIPLITVQNLDFWCTDCFQKRMDIWKWTVFGLHVIVIVISITFVTLTSDPNYATCDSSLITWRVFFATTIGSAVTFSLYFVVNLCRNKYTSGNIDNGKKQYDGETQESKLTHQVGAAAESLKLNLESVQETSFSDDIPN